MRHPNLRSFIETLRREGELLIIDEPIDPHLELAEIQRRTVAHHGPALLFTRVAGTQFRVATNLFGTRRRIELAFGEDPLRFFERLVEAAESLLPPTLSKAWAFRDLARAGARVGTKTVRSGPVLQQIHRPARLRSLPQIQAWPEDGGPFFTLPLVYTEHPSGGKSNLGMYRNQIYDDRVLGMHFQIHRGIGFHYYEAEQRSIPLPANIFLGGPPALMISAIAPLPENIPEVVLASLLLGGRIRQIRDPEISPLPIIAEADFLFSGVIPPRKRRLEGPFGDHYGYYSLAHEYPIFEVEVMCHRRDAIFPATVVGRPRQEDHYIGEYLQDLFAPIYPLVMNGVEAVWAFDDAGVHPLAAAIVRERYPKEAFMAALRILGEGQLSLTKFLMVTDSRISLRKFRPLLRHILERADFATDLFVFSNVAQDTLDYTTKKVNEGSKAVLLGLGDKKYQLRQEVQADLRNSAFRRQRVFIPGVLVVEGPEWQENDPAIDDLLKEEAVEPFRLVILTDDAVATVKDDTSFMWSVFTRFEPAADIFSRSCRIQRFHVSLSAPLLLDCRLKPWYPPVVEPDPETVKRVDALWPKIYPIRGS